MDAAEEGCVDPSARGSCALSLCGASTRVVGERIGVVSTTVCDTLKRFAWAGILMASSGGD